MNDIWTMMWKELKDLLFQGGWRASIRPLLLIGIMGIYLPLQFGLQWLALSPIELFVILWIPFSVIISFIGDAIAGERERHTLETLLASRISDRAILLGKVVVTVGYAWGMTLGGLLLGLILVNLFRGNGGGWMFYHPLDLLLEALALSLLTCLLGASAGVLVSLRTSTVRQAQQILGIGTFVLVFGGISALQALPANFVASLTYSQFLLLVMAVIAVLDAILLGLSLVSFQTLAFNLELSLMFLQQIHQPLFIVDGYTGFLRLCQLGASVFAYDQVVELFAYTGGDGATQLHDSLFGDRTCHAVQADRSAGSSGRPAGPSESGCSSAYSRRPGAVARSTRGSVHPAASYRHYARPPARYRIPG